MPFDCDVVPGHSFGDGKAYLSLSLVARGHRLSRAISFPRGVDGLGLGGDVLYALCPVESCSKAAMMFK